MAAFHRLGRHDKLPSWLVVSGAMLAVCLCSSCHTQSPSSVNGDSQAAQSSVPSAQATLAQATSAHPVQLSLAQLRQKLGSLKGKVVLIDLWALW